MIMCDKKILRACATCMLQEWLGRDGTYRYWYIPANNSVVSVHTFGVKKKASLHMDYLLIDPYQSTHHSLTPGWARLVWCTALCQWCRESYISSVTLVGLEAVSCGQIPSKETCPWSYGYQCPWVCTSHLEAIAVFACPGRTLGSPLLLWIFMEPCPECSSALIIHFCGHR